jgi:hypothetical protein
LPALAQPTGAALVLPALDVLFALDGDDDLRAEARVLIGGIAATLANETMRNRFMTSEIVRRIRAR